LRAELENNDVSISKSMAKCKINIDTDFTDYTDFHNNYNLCNLCLKIQSNMINYHLI